MTSAMAGVDTRSLLDCNIHRPTSLAEIRELVDEFPQATFLAGGTWLMRAPMRGDQVPEHVIALSGIAQLHDCVVTPDARIGAMTTLHRIAELTAGLDDLGALFDAASQAATPALRRMITVGGSIGARDFSASDIRTALACLDADITREGDLIVSIEIPRTNRISAHERLTWRSGGEYAVASASASYDPQSGDLRIAIGSVESEPRRWATVERQLSGQPLDAGVAAAVVREHCAELTPVSAPGIPGEYRLTVLPDVVARVVRRLT